MNISDPHGHFDKAFNNAELLFLDSFWLQGAKYKTVFVLRIIFFKKKVILMWQIGRSSINLDRNGWRTVWALSGCLSTLHKVLGSWSWTSASRLCGRQQEEPVHLMPCWGQKAHNSVSGEPWPWHRGGYGLPGTEKPGIRSSFGVFHECSVYSR